MSLLDEMIRKSGSANQRLRAALIAECAERAYPVFMGVSESDTPSIPRAFAIGWDYALGKPVDPAEIKACLAEIRDDIDFYLDDGNDLPGEYCVLSYRVLECLSPQEADARIAFGRGLICFLYVAVLAESHVNQTLDDQAPREEAEVESEEWVEKALDLIATWKGEPIRDMFASLGPNPPEWIKYWLAWMENT